AGAVRDRLASANQRLPHRSSPVTEARTLGGIDLRAAPDPLGFGEEIVSALPGHHRVQFEHHHRVAPFVTPIAVVRGYSLQRAHTPVVTALPVTLFHLAIQCNHLNRPRRCFWHSTIIAH